MKQANLTRLITGLVLLGCSSTAVAIPLLSGDSVFVTGTTVAESPELAGSIVRDTIIGPYDLEPSLGPFALAGHDYQDRVVQSSLTNSLIFAPRLRDPINITFFDFLIDGFVLDGYSGFETDVSYRTDGLGEKGPSFAERSADGDNLTFLFGFPLLLQNLVQKIHEESFFINILTDATAFDTTGSITIFGRRADGDAQGEVVFATIDGIAAPSRDNVDIPSPATTFLWLIVVWLFSKKHGGMEEHQIQKTDDTNHQITAAMTRGQDRGESLTVHASGDPHG